MKFTSDVGPNITGSVSNIHSSHKDAKSIGSLGWGGIGTHLMAVNESESKVNIVFDAARSNSIYSGLNVQASALQLLACIRI